MTIRNALTPRRSNTHGIGLTWTGGFNEVPAQTQVQRAPDNGSGSPDTSNAVTAAVVSQGVEEFIDFLPNDGERRHYRIRHVGRNVTASDWTGWVSAVPAYIGVFAVAPNIPTRLPSATVVAADSVERVFPRNPVLAADTAGNTLLEDGDAVVFGGFENPPNAWALPQSVSVWESTLTTGSNTALRLELENITATGADVVAKLQQPGSATNRDDGFSASAITTEGGTQNSDTLATANLPAVNDTFTIRGTATFTNTSTKFWATGQLRLRIYSYDGSTTNTTLRSEFVVGPEIVLAPSQSNVDVSFARTVIAPDVDGGGTDYFVLEVYENLSSSPIVTFSVTGENTSGYTTNGVAWQTATVTEVAATSAARGSFVSFLLMEADQA